MIIYRQVYMWSWKFLNVGKLTFGEFSNKSIKRNM